MGLSKIFRRIDYRAGTCYNNYISFMVFPRGTYSIRVYKVSVSTKVLIGTFFVFPGFFLLWQV